MKAACLAVFASLGVAGSVPADDFLGVCAHVTWHEFDGREKTFAMLRKAGIGWVRSDVEFWRCRPKKPGDAWNFSRYDAVYDSAKKYGVKVLPIFMWVREWGLDDFAAHEREWTEFVREFVRHFRGRVPYCEICNEPNLPLFWNNPNPANYAKALKASYRAVKAESAETKVLISGFAGVPLDFIEGVYRADGKDFFDVMNVHPYTWPNPPGGALESRLAALAKLMAKYDDGAKPVWITEMGWPTHKVKMPARGLFLAGLKAARPERTVWRIGYADSTDDLGRGQVFAAAMAESLPKGSVAKAYTASELNAALERDELDAVVYPFDESFPLDTIKPVAQFVKRGGVLVDFGGCPMWSPVSGGKVVEKTPDGKLIRGLVRTQLRIDVHWPGHGNGLKEDERTFATPAADAAGLKSDPNGFPCRRFFSGALLKEGDEFVPLTTAKDKDGRELAGVCVYRFNSDLTGAVVVAGCGNDRGGTGEEAQADYLKQAIGIAREKGVEKFFIYEFRAPEKDAYYSEDHFGIVHADFTPKPAFAACQDFVRQSNLRR